jgi:hypothetical protein
MAKDRDRFMVRARYLIIITIALVSVAREKRDLALSLLRSSIDLIIGIAVAYQKYSHFFIFILF